MPTYEYRCPKGHEFDLFQRMSDEPGADCPECGEASERLLSGGAGFLFKGDGFYITDSRSDSYKKEASKESTPEVPATTSDADSKKSDKKAAEPSTKVPSPPPKGS
jgi:putative FmdB family regulatory protein